MLRKIIITAVLPFVISTQIFSQLAPSNPANNASSKTCIQHSSPPPAEWLLQEPNGVCSEEPADTEKEDCPKIPIARATQCPIISQLMPPIQDNPQGVAESLRSMWICNLSSPSYLNGLSRIFSRVQKSGELDEAIRGFSAGLAQREQQAGEMLPDDERSRFLMLVFLPVIESGWRYLFSDRKAYGPYQFTAETARKYGLIRRITDNEGNLIGMIDRRHKNYDAAFAAAQLLYDLYHTFNRDINLALSAYNSGMPFTYYTHTRRSDINVDYNGYLQFLAKKLNDGDRAQRFIIENINFAPKVNAVISVISSRYPELALYAISATRLSELQPANSCPASHFEKWKRRDFENKVCSLLNTAAGQKPPMRKVNN